MNFESQNIQFEEKDDVMSPRCLNYKFIRQRNIINKQQFKKKMKLQQQFIDKCLGKVTQDIGIIQPVKQYNMNGNIIKGRKFQTKFHGDIEVIYKNGQYFKGKYQRGVRVSGYFKFKSGITYEGGFIHDQFKGQGTLTFIDGTVIKGHFQGSEITQNAMIEYPSGDTYYGSIKDLKKHGYGYIFFNDDRKYIGQVQNGLVTGYGAYYIKNKKVGEGLWQNGRLMTTGGFSRKQSTNQMTQLLSCLTQLTKQEIVLSDDFQKAIRLLVSHIKHQDQFQHIFNQTSAMINQSVSSIKRLKSEKSSQVPSMKVRVP